MPKIEFLKWTQPANGKFRLRFSTQESIYPNGVPWGSSAQKLDIVFQNENLKSSADLCTD